jgi:hypothetical protein
MKENEMAIGPVEYMVVGFPGNKFKGEIAPALQELVESGTIRIIDLAIVVKDGDGNVAGMELEDAGGEVFQAFQALTAERGGLINDDDLMDIGASRAISSRPRSISLRANPSKLDQYHSNRHKEERPMMRRRRGPGLVRMAAGTAVIAGTAGAVRHHQEQKYANQAAEQQAEQQAIYDQGVAAAQAAQAPVAAAPAADPQMEQLQKLASLHAQGILSDEEFAAAKAKALGI